MLCRVCLKESKCSLQMFDMNGIQLGIADILRRHFWFQPQPDDPISTVICRICWIKISDFHQFYVTVEQAHLSLGKYPLDKDNEIILCEVNIKEEMIDHLVEDNRTAEENTETKNPLHEAETCEITAGEIAAENENVEDIKIEAREEPAVIEEKSVKDEKSRKRKCVLKIKPHPEVDSNDDDDCDSDYQDDFVAFEDEVKTRKRKCISKKKPSSSVMDTSGNEDDDNKDCETARDTESKVKDRARKRKSVPKKRLPRRIIYTKDEEEDSDNEDDQNKRKKAMITQQDDEIVKKHIPMGCNLCAFVGEDFGEMSRHFRVQHTSVKPYIICCNKKLDKRFKVVQHAYRHEDPAFFKCHDCQKTFSDRYTLRSHMVAAHAPEELLTFSCDLCPKKFPRKYLLELHKPSHVPLDERSFICDQCPNAKARFASNHLLKIHISMRHRRATNVCHVCAKEIRDKQSFEKHVRLHTEDSGPRVKCPRPDCDRWLKDEENLRQHMRRHNDEGQIFRCTECDRVCKNRRALRSHIHYVHSNEVFTCEECHKSFKKAITLREHMAQHTGESLYKCPFCTRTFNSNANMHSHKKKMHPIEWDNWRKTKRGSSQKVITKNSGLQSVAKSFDIDNVETPILQ